VVVPPRAHAVQRALVLARQEVIEPDGGDRQRATTATA
jgi:hypothetical protein